MSSHTEALLPSYASGNKLKNPLYSYFPLQNLCKKIDKVSYENRFDYKYNLGLSLVPISNRQTYKKMQ